MSCSCSFDSTKCELHTALVQHFHMTIHMFIKMRSQNAESMAADIPFFLAPRIFKMENAERVSIVYSNNLVFLKMWSTRLAI